jgi:CubicO group peptidase (beta-lactamase class C family)
MQFLILNSMEAKDMQRITKTIKPFLFTFLCVTLLLFPTELANAQRQRRNEPPNRPNVQRQGRDGSRRGQGNKQNNSDIEANADQIIANMMREQHIPGVALAIVKNGQVVLKKGYGEKSLNSHVAPDENTVFNIGSLSKAITGVGAMVLVDDGKLNLDDPASKYIKDLPQKWRRITVKQFMTHTSGIPQLSNKVKKKLETIHDAFGIAADQPFEFQPGTKMHYNNFNFAVTGRLIEVISGMTYLDFMKERVFRPLQMDHTGGGGDLASVSADHARGYVFTNGSLKPGVFDIQPFGWPSGGLYTTLSDLLKLEQALRTGTLLKPATYQQMIAKYPVGTGTPGWFAKKADGVTLISKNGAGKMGFSSYFIFVPERGDTYILLRTNIGGIGKPTRQLTEKCLGIPLRGGTDESDRGADDGGSDQSGNQRQGRGGQRNNGRNQ